MDRDRTRRLAVILGMSAVVCGCTRLPGASARNVVIVTLDTTRADYLEAYGSARSTTPTLSRLAREGVVFEQAMTVAPLTLTAHCSLFTGLRPPDHGVRDNAAAPLAARHVTLAEVLRGRGFQTAAFTAAAVLASDRGLARGFQVYHDGRSPDRWSPRRMRRPGSEVLDDALAWLDTRDGSPFFLWVHLYDAHGPYTLDEPYRSLYRDDPYAGEIAFADAQLGRLLDSLERRDLLERTAIIVAGDHGESLGSTASAATAWASTTVCCMFRSLPAFRALVLGVYRMW